MENTVAQIIGFIAMALCLLCFQIRNSRLLILCKALGEFLYVIHYLMLGAYSGCATLFIGVLSGLLCGLKGNLRWANWKGWPWVFSSLLVAVCFVLWKDAFDPIPCLCSLAAIVAVIFFTWSGSGRRIRMGKLFAVGPMWLVYCLTVHSYPGALCEIIGMGSAAIGIFRYDLKIRKK